MPRMHKRGGKYNAVKVKADGYTFDSKAEYHRYLVLRDMHDNGEIDHLIMHPKFVIVPGHKHGGETIRQVTYAADFAYIDRRVLVIEDVKGHPTQVYKIKKAIMTWRIENDKSLQWHRNTPPPSTSSYDFIVFEEVPASLYS